MFPYLFQIGDLAVHSYTFFLGLAFVVGLALSYPKFKNTPLSQERFITHAFISFVVSLIGARLLFLLVRWELFLKGDFSFLSFWQGGIVFLGGLIAGAIYWIVIFRKHKMPLLDSIDLMIEGLSLGHSIGRIGCFLNGCCFGSYCPISFFSVTYTNEFSAAPTQVSLYPVQIIESIWLVLIAILVGNRINIINKYNFLREFRPLAIYCGLYGTGRFFLEFLRGDIHRGFWGPFSTSQWISLVLIVIGVLIGKKHRVGA